MPHAGADLDRVALDLHPPAAPVAELAARHLAVEALAVELEARGKALDDRDQAGAVRLAGGCEAKRRHRAANPSDARGALLRALPPGRATAGRARAALARACPLRLASTGARLDRRAASACRCDRPRARSRASPRRRPSASGAGSWRRSGRSDRRRSTELTSSETRKSACFTSSRGAGEGDHRLASRWAGTSAARRCFRRLRSPGGPTLTSIRRWNSVQGRLRGVARGLGGGTDGVVLVRARCSSVDVGSAGRGRRGRSASGRRSPAVVSRRLGDRRLLDLRGHLGQRELLAERVLALELLEALAVVGHPELLGQHRRLGGGLLAGLARRPGRWRGAVGRRTELERAIGTAIRATDERQRRQQQPAVAQVAVEVGEEAAAARTFFMASERGALEVGARGRGRASEPWSRRASGSRAPDRSGSRPR